MKRYCDFRPSPWDRTGSSFSALAERLEWYVLPCTITRDSEALDLSNWHAAMDRMEAIDPDGEAWEVHRFNHWAVGWFEILLVKPRSILEREAFRIEEELEAYPVLDEDDYSEREHLEQTAHEGGA
jgi:hypothetical protein